MGPRADVFTVKEISKYQFAAFRIIFGLYLLGHFLHLFPYGPEIFSNQGVFPDPKLNLTFGIFPNVLYLWDSPGAVRGFLGLMALFSFFFVIGYHRKFAALILWYGWACLFNRNNLISNPGLPYVGLILLLTLLIPAAEALAYSKQGKNAEWHFPAGVFWVAWFLMASGYTFSGIIKLSSPSWVNGSAMVHLVTNPLARPGIIRDFFLTLPQWATSLATWGALASEILFLPLSFHRKTRLVAWLLMIGMHFGILTMVAFADLTAGMLMIHLFTFDPEWLPARAKDKGKLLVLYDGVCGLCDQTIQFFLEEDKDAVLKYAPLQGDVAMEVMKRHSGLTGDLTSMVFVEDYGGPDEKLSFRSDGVLRAVGALGGFWRVVSWATFFPQRVRNAAYDFIAKHRYQWFGKYDECKVPTAEVRQRFLG